MTLSVAELFGSSVAFYRARLGLYLALGVVFVAVPSLVVAGSAAVLPAWIGSVVQFALALFSGLLAVWMQAAAMMIARDDAAGTNPSVGKALNEASARLLVLVGIAILLSLGVGIGFVFFVIPGLFLAVIWAVSLPAAALGGAGVVEAFQESMRLTKGNRITILVLFVLVFSVAVAVSVSVGLMIAVAGAPLLVALFNALFGAVSTTFTAVMLTVLYITLTRLAGEAAA